MALTARVAARTDIGRVRKSNEDAIITLPERGLFILADGLGGHRGGATASRIVVTLLPELLERNGRDSSSRATSSRGRLRLALADLNTLLRRESSDRQELAGMGATVVALMISDQYAYVANLGDSRAYLFRRGRLRRLTKDHTVAATLLRRDEISVREARDHPSRHQLTRYVGMEGQAVADLKAVRLLHGDRVMLCSDGLTGMLSDRRLADLLSNAGGPDMTCSALVQAANEAGGQDNVSTIVIDLDTSP